MKEKIIIYEQIELYLKGELKGEALQQFEEKLNQEPEFRAEVELHRDLEISIRDEEGDVEFKSVLLEEGQNFVEQTQVESAKVVRMSATRKWAYAASFLLLIALAVWLFNLSESGSDYNQMFAQEFQPAALTEVQRSENPEIPASLLLAYDAYEQKDFQLAIQNFEVAQTIVNSPSTHYYLGISYLAKNQPEEEKALVQFSEVIADGNSSFVSGAKWYSALTYLKTNQLEEAKSLLEELSVAPSKYNSDAQKLLRSL